MAPAVLISSTPGCPLISLRSITGSRDGGGIGPNLAVTNCDIRRAPVLASTRRCSGGVVVKNGCANRKTGGLRDCTLGFVFLAMHPPERFPDFRPPRSRSDSGIIDP